jgi:nucleotide-binding universal stress UspA family protein
MSFAAEDDERFGPERAPLAFERGTDGPRVIMVGLDGSVTSMRAAAFAVGLARRQGSELVVVFVAAPSPFVAMAGGASAALQEQSLRDLADELRDQVRRGAQELGVSATFVTRRGDPYTELRRIADEIRADMVVVGVSTQAGHRLVGSIATRLVRTGKWPVVVVP